MAPEIVVGGGVAGLAVARRLALAGRRVVVMEASDRLGGQIARQELAGAGLDSAAESFATRDGAVAALLEELGLGADVVPPNPSPAWLYRADGTAVPLPATGLLGIPGDPGAEDVRRAIGEAAAEGALRDAELPSGVGADATSLGELVEARMGRGVLEGLVAPVVRGVHSRDPWELPVEAASPRLRAELRERGSLAAAVRALRAASPAGSQVAAIRGGMHRLVEVLAADCARLGVELETGVRVHAITPDGVETTRGRRSGRVVLAAADPAAPPAARSVTVVTLIAEAPRWDGAPRGTGLLVAAGARGVTARALTHLSAKWDWVADALPGRHAVRLSYDSEPDDPAARAAADAAVLLGAPAGRILAVSWATWRRPVGRPVGGRADGIPVAGETAAGTGLAAVLAHAERMARGLTG